MTIFIYYLYERSICSKAFLLCISFSFIECVQIKVYCA